MSGSSLGGTGMNAGTFDLTNTNLFNVNLSGSFVEGFIFQRTNLANANLAGTVFMSVNLRNAILDGANISGTTLGNGNDLYGLRAHNVTGTPASLPPSWKVVSNRTSAQFLIGPGADLTGADLTGADLTGADLTGADLTGADLTNADLTDAHLQNVVLQATCHYAILTNSHLEGADLTHASLTGVVSGGITAAPSLRANWQLTANGYLIGPYANLTNATLTGENLTGAALTGVTGAAKYNTATTLPAGFDPVAAGWTLVS